MSDSPPYGLGRYGRGLYGAGGPVGRPGPFASESTITITLQKVNVVDSPLAPWVEHSVMSLQGLRVQNGLTSASRSKAAVMPSIVWEKVGANVCSGAMANSIYLMFQAPP